MSLYHPKRYLHFYSVHLPLVALLMFFLPLLLSAQSSAIDSLRALLDENPEDTTRMEILVNLGKHIQRSDPESGIAYYSQVLQIAQELSDTTYLLKALSGIGNCFYDKGELEAAEENWSRAMEISKVTNDSLGMGRMGTNLGIIFETRGDLDAAIRAYQQALICLQNDSPKSIALTQNNLALVYEKQGNYTKAIDCFLKALAGFELESSDRGKAAILGNIGMVYYRQKTYPQAVNYYYRSLNIKQKLNDLVGMAITYNNLGGLYETTEQLDSAIYFHQKSLKIKEQLGDQLGICASYNNLGIAYYHSGDYSLARDFQKKAYKIAQETNSKSELARSGTDLGRVYLKLGQFDLAERYLLSAFPLSEEVGEQENKLKIYQSLFELYKARKDFRAVDFYEKYVALNDSLRNDEQTREITRLEMQYQFDREKEVLALERERNEAVLNSKVQRQLLLRNVSLVLLVAGLIILLLLGRSFRQKQQSNRLLEAQKNTIQQALEDREILLKEIHHRVKNNLQIISSLLNLQSRQIDDPKALEAIQEGRNRVQSMALIHKNLYQDGDLVGVDVAEYIGKLTDGLITSYNINPQNITIHKDIDPLKLDVDTIIPLGLILNELIGNALKYAFTNGQPGALNMALKKEPEGLRLSISDNGQGLPSDFDLESLKSLGFRLVKAFTQKLEGVLSIRSENGTLVEILIPKYKAV